MINKKCNCNDYDGPDSCWVCINGDIYHGYIGSYWQPSEPPSVECRIEGIWELYESLEQQGYDINEIDITKFCKHFKRKAPTICRHCSEY